MSKKCPSCGANYEYLLQCDDCGRQFCDVCCDNKFFVIPIMVSKHDPGPAFRSACPDCGSDDYSVVSEIDSEDPSEDHREHEEEFEPPRQTDYASSHTSSYSPSYTSYSSGPFSGYHPLVLAAIYFLVPVTMTALARHIHVAGAFDTGFPDWFYFLWPAAVAMTIFLSALELLTALFGGPTPNLHS